MARANTARAKKRFRKIKRRLELGQGKPRDAAEFTQLSRRLGYRNHLQKIIEKRLDL